MNELNCDHVAKSQKDIMCEAETLASSCKDYEIMM